MSFYKGGAKFSQNVHIKSKGHLPSDDDEAAVQKLFQLISLQTDYINHLEGENGVIVREFQTLKRRLADIIEENHAIHDELQGRLVSQTLDESNAVIDKTNLHLSGRGTNSASSTLPVPPVVTSERDVGNDQTDKHLHWKKELDSVEALYSAKMLGLEAQIKTTEKSLKDALKENEVLKLQLKKANDPPNNTEPLLGSGTSHYGVNAPLIKRLTSERDDLLKTATSLQARIGEYQKQESVLRQEVQKSLVALEDIQLQKTKILVEKEQLKDDLKIARQKLDEEIVEGQKRLLDVAAQQRVLCAKDMEEMQIKIGELMASCAHHEQMLEKCGREKANLSLQLDDSRAQLLQTERNLARMQAEVKGEVKSALKGYSAAEQELRDARGRVEEELMRTNQERTRYEQQAVELQRRVDASEQHALKLQEMNIATSQQLNDKLSELAKVKQKLDKIVDTSSANYNELKLESEERIARLTATLQASEMEYEKRISDLEQISCKQASLIEKLRSECRQINSELDQLSHKYREEVGELGQRNEQLALQTNRLTNKNRELSEQCVQHGVTHRAMQERLTELNNRAHLCSNQVLDLLDQQTQLSHDKQALGKEVRFLQSQVLLDDTI